MTDLAQTRPETPAQAPPWLNLDTVIPPDVRAEIASLIDRARKMLPVVEPLFEAMTEMELRVERLLNDVPDGLEEYLFDLVRLTEMLNLRLHIVGIAEPCEFRDSTLTEADAF